MKNKWLILAGAVALTAFSTVQATQITGQVDMSGTATLDNSLLGSATKATAFSAVTVGGSPSGSFAGTAGDSVTWSAFTWTPAGGASPLWVFFDVGTGWTYKFNLITDTIVSQSNFFLNLTGTGTLMITGGSSSFVPTAGAWSFTISNPTGGAGDNMQFTFANSQVAVIPDGGATVMLLGAALSAMGLFRKKLIA